MSQPSSPGDRRISLPFGRIALLLAALVAVLAIGIRLTRGGDGDGVAAPQPAAAPPAAPPAMPDVSTMIARLEARLKDNPDDAKSWSFLAWSYYSTNRHADAARAYARAAALEPDNADHWSALGEALLLAGPGGVTAEAESAFRRALAIDPKDARARYFMAVKRNMAGDHKGAVEEWIALLNEAPAGAPWAPPVRDLLLKVAAEEKIDIAGRVPELQAAAAAPPAAHPTMAPGAAVAGAGIPGPTREQMQAASGLPPGQQDAMVRGMVDGLAAKLKANPRDGDGWIRLMRARMVLGEGRAAAQALADARAAFAGDQAQLARLADAARLLGVPGAG